LNFFESSLDILEVIKFGFNEAWDKVGNESIHWDEMEEFPIKLDI